MPNQNNFIRPSSTTIYNNHNLHNVKQQQQLSNAELSKRRTSILILTLISIVIFLFILSLLLICALVAVGKGIDKKGLSTIASDNISSISLINRAQIHNSIDNSDSKLNKNNMSVSKVVENLTFRLPKSITPIAYNLFLNPNLEDSTFSGNVKIDIAVSERMNFIALHSQFLNVTKTKLVRQLQNGLEGIDIKNTFPYEKFEYFVIEPEVSLDAGNYTIDMDFDGDLDHKIIGFYSSTYFDNVKNQKRTIATSKFEPTFARQSFPCFDEPSMKAKYKITLVSPDGDGYHALSNMNIESVDTSTPGIKKVTFAESVPMSTYLTVFIVSDFLDRSGPVNVGKPIGDQFDLSIYSTPAQINKTQYAFDSSKKVIEFYIDYFQIPYPLPKLGLAAIPDFVSGAMETWGLITYRETNLLYDAAVSSTNNKQRILAVIAHEFAHMWFGNLVTMRWWNDLWLNEGFASYIEFKGMNAAEPSWDMENQFTIDTMHSVLDLDATLGSHPIVVSVETPNQITEIFDSITYNKGASIIRMIEDFVGPDNFQKGVTDYLNEMKYKNADSDDLLRNLKTYTNEDIFSIVNTWIRQKGIPVVNVKKTGSNTYELTQKRFFTDPENEGKETVESEYNYKWSIPITFTTSTNKTVQRNWFYHNMNSLSISVDPTATWIKINDGQKGYYRVNYETDMWKSISDALIAQPTTFSILDRAHLLNDVFSLAQANEVSYATALTMTGFLKDDLSFVPWDAVSTKLKNIRNLLYNTEYYKDFLAYVNQLVDEPYKKIDWNIDINKHLDNLYRITILDLACSFGHEECLKKMSEQFREWLDSGVSPHPDVRSWVYTYGMKNANEQDWERVLEIFLNESDATEKSKLQAALANIDDPIILERYIELASKDETYVRQQDYFSFLSSVAGNRKYGEQLVWDYVRTNWPKLVDRFGLSERNLGRMIPSVTSRMAKEIRVQEMEDFFAKYPDAGAGANARIQALENIRNNIKWLAKNKDSIGEFLNNP